MEKVKVILLAVILSISYLSFGQLLKTQGKVIVNDQDEEVLLRGVGPGGWQIMEGYMMQTSDVAGSQHEIKEKLIDLMGESNTETFFEKWRENHFTQRDVDSLAAWGFNSIRIPMHYNLFTLPIEDEPVQGEHTWIETGFELIDDVLEWSAPHGIYVILDMHACPGAQGIASAEINDYDPDKSSLWEDHPNDLGGSQRNKDKLVALWTRIAERYKDEEWIGGYDLINETHFDLPGGIELRELYVNITNAIRSVDTNHIIFIEGNWYANDYSGLTPPWDNNMVYSFHKYWSYNTDTDLDWVLPMREQHNVPLWMGESGENSNTWFTDAVKLFEDNGIGWAWWTMRKIGDIDSPYAVDIDPSYQKIIDYWKGEGSKPTEQETFDGMMQLAENLLVPNSRYRKDVLDALIRQPHTDETIPYANHEIPGIVYLSDFDLGKNGIAYLDKDVADYHLSTGSFQAWNDGWSYRNDGVDIQTNEDNVNSNGFHIGFTNKGEWVKYTIEIAEGGAYRADIRLATDLSNSQFHLSIDNQSITTSQLVSHTGGYEQFETHAIEDIILTEGRHELRIHFDQSAVNVSSIEFINTGTGENLPFEALTGQIGVEEQSVELTVSKAILESSLVDTKDLFSVTVNGQTEEITEIVLSTNGDRSITLSIQNPILFSDQVKLTYNGTTINSLNNDPLGMFTNLPVINTLPERFVFPGKLEAEAYEFQSGLSTEETTDSGGGSNISFTDAGDYADYRIFVRNEGNFIMNIRVAAQNKSGRVGFYLLDEESNETELVTMSTPVTGGWQTWETVSEYFEMPAGLQTLRMKVLNSGFNINWFDVDLDERSVTDVSEIDDVSNTTIYPKNPTSGTVYITNTEFNRFEVYSLSGAIKLSGYIPANRTIELNKLNSGLYLLKTINTKRGNFSQHKIIIDK